MELLVINIVSTFYIVVSVYQRWKHKNTMSSGAYHHMLSHLYITCFSVLAVNIYMLTGIAAPIVFAFLYIIQHVSKENSRLIKTNKWTDSVSEDL